MTKADILRILERVPMNTGIVFVAEREQLYLGGSDDESEHEVKAAFTVTGTRGLTLLLTDGRTPSAPEYEDLESVR